MGGAVKDSANPFFKSRYADLTSVWKACKDALHDNGFSVIQSPINEDGRVGVATMLLHTSGQFISDSYTLGVKKDNDPQADGSSITYARRYALAAFVGVCPVDDDGEGAMHRNKPKPTPPKPKPAPSKHQAEVDKYLIMLNEVADESTKEEYKAWWGIPGNGDKIKATLPEAEAKQIHARYNEILKVKKD
jgi:hypothetical protein